jgi:hypothetical protein
MRSMRSMRGGFIFRSPTRALAKGPRYAMARHVQWRRVVYYKSHDFELRLVYSIELSAVPGGFDSFFERSRHMPAACVLVRQIGSSHGGLCVCRD